MNRRRTTVVTVAAIATATVGIATALYVAARMSGNEPGPRPAGPAITDVRPTGFAPSNDPSYWTEERLRSAQPQELPTD